MTSAYDYVYEFHKVFDGVIRTTPTLLDGDELKLRKNLLEEEYTELMEALESDDLEHIYKEAADLLYVLYGLDLHMGSKLDEVVREVHRSNMSKAGPNGEILVRESDGKILKHPNYSPADLTGII